MCVYCIISVSTQAHSKILLGTRKLSKRSAPPASIASLAFFYLFQVIQDCKTILNNPKIKICNIKPILDTKDVKVRFIDVK